MNALSKAGEQVPFLGGLLAFFLLITAGGAHSHAPSSQTGEQAEALAGAAQPALNVLVDALRFGAGPDQPTEAWAIPGARWPLPKIPEAEPAQPQAEGLTLNSVRFGDGEPAPAGAWLAALRTHLAPHGPWEYTKTKTIAVLPSEGDGFRTRVRVEMTTSGRADAVLHLMVTWDGAEPCRALAVQAETLSLALPTEPLWVEKTRGLFSQAPQAGAWLSVGGRAWSKVLDDAGATAWFGHQGMAFGDVNGDGLPDAYLGMPNGVPNLLLLQQADGTVRQAAAASGAAWLDDTKGVLLVDLDRDGDRDLVTALHHVLVLHSNNGQGEFSVAGWCAAPTEAPFYSIAASDVDLDGDLDLFGVRYVRSRYGDSIPIPLEDARNGPSNHLFRNDGDFQFTDVTKAVWPRRQQQPLQLGCILRRL